MRYYECDNSSWIASSRQDIDDVNRLFTIVSTTDDQLQPTKTKLGRRKSASAAPSIATVNRLLRDWCAKQVWLRSSRKSTERPNCDESEQMQRPIDRNLLQKWLQEEPPHFVAIKRINSTSGPKRIAEELLYLSRLSGRKGVIPVITAERFEDQVLVVFPFFQNQDFRVIQKRSKNHNIS